MMASASGSIWGRIPARMQLSVTPRTKVIALSVALGLAFYSILKYFRKDKKKSTQDSKRNAKKGPLPDLVARGVSPAGSSLQGRYPAHPAGGVDLGPTRSRALTHMRDSFSIASLDERQLPRTTEALVHFGMENLSEAIKQWERAVTVNINDKGKPLNEQELYESLESILEKAREIQIELKRIIGKYSLDVPDNVSIASTLTPAYAGGMLQSFGAAGDHVMAHHGYGTLSAGKRTLSVLSDESFQSALDDLIPSMEDIDILGREHLHIEYSDLLFYHEGLKEAAEGNVLCRVMRSEFLQCGSDEDFLAKLWCIRRAMNYVMSDETHRHWLANTGRKLIADLMRQAKKDPSDFGRAFDTMIDYLQDPDVWSEVRHELANRRVAEISFYDVVMDFILMDAFDDLASPPSAVLAVAQNRFFSASVKESTLRTLVWSVLKAKRARLQKADGFISRFYDISEQVSPVMAWGFLGTDDHLKQLCYYFKDQICNLLMDMFSFERVHYTSLRELAEDIWLTVQTRAEMTQNRINTELLVEE